MPLPSTARPALAGDDYLQAMQTDIEAMREDVDLNAALIVELLTKIHKTLKKIAGEKE